MKFLNMAAAAALVLSACSASVPANAEDLQLTIAVGQEGRGYEAFGKDMVARLKTTLPAKTKNYEGSDDISLAVCSNEAQVGIMQIDAMYTRGLEGCNLRIVGDYGKEYAYLLVPEDSDLDELHDFTDKTRILVDTVGSGTDLFWQTIVAIETGEEGNNSTWSAAKPVNDPVFLASAMASAGEIDAVLLVVKPDSAELAELIAEGWETVELSDKDINDLAFNGSSLYPVEKAEIPGSSGFFGSDSVSTYAIRSFVVANEAYSRDRKGFAAVARAAKTVKASR